MAKMFIAGEWVDAYSGKTADAVNPSTGQLIETFPLGDREDARRAIDAADVGSEKAASMPAHARSRILLKVAEIMERHIDEMARLISLNVGKPVVDAELEVKRAALTFTFAAEEAKRLYGETIPLDAYPLPPGNENRFAFTKRDPVGVVAAISPFNFPLNLLAHKVAPAIAAGNSVVAKPPSDGPLPAIKLAEYFTTAGLPAGVYNVVTGPGSTVGDEIVSSLKVAAISFTGDTSTGRTISEKAARTNKKLILELGGHDPMIILDDSDVAKAAQNATLGVFTYSGQVCTATKRIIIHEGVFDRFRREFVKSVSSLKVGDPLDRTVNVGPVINLRALEKIGGLVGEAVERGASVASGGSRLQDGNFGRGFFYAPTILEDVTPEMKISQEEIFGPVAPLITVSSDEQAVQVANGTIYGLQAAVFSNNLKRALKIALRIRAGAVLINDRNNLRWDNAPFGGVKQSGLGREGVRYAIAELTEPKLIVMNLE